MTTFYIYILNRQIDWKCVCSTELGLLFHLCNGSSPLSIHSNSPTILSILLLSYPYPLLLSYQLFLSHSLSLSLNLYLFLYLSLSICRASSSLLLFSIPGHSQILRIKRRIILYNTYRIRHLLPLLIPNSQGKERERRTCPNLFIHTIQMSLSYIHYIQ